MSLDTSLPAEARSLRSDPAEGPKSPAWLAAEQAFALRQQAPPAEKAAVVIIRRRRARIDAEATEDRPATSAEALPVSTAQQAQPRVFRLDGARPTGAVQAVAATPAAPSPVPAAARRRRPAAERRPGPVARIVVEPPAAPAEPEPDGRFLAERLAEVEPILEAIRTAQAFRFTGERWAAGWEQLSRAAEQLGRQMAQGPLVAFDTD